MPPHSKQHFVPQSYLKAWCDPAMPEGQEPYVWRFEKDGTDPRRKAPENIFHERDIYTIRGADGGRDLVLEHGLKGLEDWFVGIRDTKLSKREELTPEEWLQLCAFIAAAHTRTPTQRDHIGAMWGEALKKADHMKKWAKTATPQQKRAAASLPRSRSDKSFSYEEVKAMAERPMEMMLVPMIQTMAPLLARLDGIVLETDDVQGFITSDYPCVWFDPEASKRPPLYQGVGLVYQSVEITLPISPRQLIMLNRRRVSGFAKVDGRWVDEMNRRTRFHCSKHFVSNTNATRPIWFDPGVEPADSWRKTHPRPMRDASTNT
jgi:uncharacterized protein DUF4238